jgi:hypothetical protein
MSKKYTATLRYSRNWDIEIEADSLEVAQESAQAWADSEDNQLDANEREWVALVEVVEREEVNA